MATVTTPEMPSTPFWGRGRPGGATMLWLFAVFFLFLAIHPFTTYPVTLLFLKRLRKTPNAPALPDSGGAPLPSAAFCVAAYNEESVIVAKVENMLRLATTVSSCQILVYVDAATDSTAELLEPYRDRIDVIAGRTRQGKSFGLKTLIERATADILVFTDANVILDEKALSELCRRFADPEVGCVCGHLVYGNGAESSTAAVGDLYWRLEEAIHQLESDTVGIVGADGSLFATRRSMHRPAPPDLVDDFYVSMRILLEGHKVVRAGDALAFERAGSNEGEEFDRRVRIACRAFNVHRELWSDICSARPGILYAYVSHKLLKWFIAYNLMAASLFGLAAAFAAFHSLQLGAVLVVVGLLAAALWRFDVSPSRQIGSMCFAFVGAALGVAKSMRGERFQTWNPIATARMAKRARP